MCYEQDLQDKVSKNMRCTGSKAFHLCMLNTGSARHLETWNTPGYLFGIFQDLENLEK